MGSVDRRKQFVKDHASEAMPCPRCRSVVSHMWMDGSVPGMVPVAHNCVNDYTVDLTPDCESGTLFDIAVS